MHRFLIIGVQKKNVPVSWIWVDGQASRQNLPAYLYWQLPLLVLAAAAPATQSFRSAKGDAMATQSGIGNGLLEAQHGCALQKLESDTRLGDIGQGAAAQNALQYLAISASYRTTVQSV